MNDRNFKIAGLIILAVGGYFIYSRVKTNQKNSDVDVIISSGSFSNKKLLLTFDPPFVTAWANAVKAKTPIFTYLGKKYNAQGGKAVK